MKSIKSKILVSMILTVTISLALVGGDCMCPWVQRNAVYIEGQYDRDSFHCIGESIVPAKGV